MSGERPVPEARAIDLNADAGEGFDSEALFAAVSTVSIACGGHAGDEGTMAAALALARACGVAVGAHPGYEDRGNFGRVETGASAEAIGALVERQLSRLLEAASATGSPLAHVKPHGALYHRAGSDPTAARALVETIARIDPGLALLAAPGSGLLVAAKESGLRSIREGFVDRRYDEAGGLVPRSSQGALLEPNEAVAQGLRLAATEMPGSCEVAPASGLPFYRSLCLHSDAPEAAALARALRRALEGAGLALVPFAARNRLVELPEIHVVGAAIVEGGRVLLTRRSPRMSLAGKWEFPGGKVEAGEAPAAALAREIREELGLEIEVGARLGRGTALHAGRRIVLEVFLARRTGGHLALVEHEEHGWFTAPELAPLDWPEADLPILPALTRTLRDFR